MTTKRIVWTDDNGIVRRLTPSPESMKALTNAGGMLDPAHIWKQTTAYTKAGMSPASARRLAEGYAKGGLTESEALDLTRACHFARHHYSEGTNVTVVEAADLPYWGSFGRFAWRQDGATAPIVDMARARPIKTDQIRVERDKRFAALDINYIRADEAGNVVEKQRIAILKQKLRDLPATVQPDLAAITTPEALEAWEPPWPT